MDVSAVAPFFNVQCPSCGAHTRVKLKFGPYQLVRRHAVGGMSMVFVAHDPTLEREVALKILSEDFSADERRIAAFEEEARITASFSHPHVVRVLTTGRAFGRFYIAMELVPGGHFEHQIRERGKIPEVEMLPLAIEVAQGLKAAHAAGLIHRDVKPGNILLDADGHAKLVDFGLALVTQGGKATATEVWATPYYVPPETIEGHAEDFRSDIYAFGATIYHALLGAPSCGEETMSTDILREAKRKVIPLGVAAPWLSEETCRIVERAMAHDPQGRFSSYDDLIRHLQAALKRLSSAGPGAAETSGAAAKRRARKKQREMLGLAAGVVFLLGLVGGGVFLVTRDEVPVAKTQAPRVELLEPLPETDLAAATAVAAGYRDAREALVAGDFVKAALEFRKLLENPKVQEPTRTWAGVEAVAAAFLGGESADAKRMALETAAHAAAVADARLKIDLELVGLLRGLQEIPSIPVNAHAAAVAVDASLMVRLLAGLKNWEQGALALAAANFERVKAAEIPADAAWLRVYQERAADYLADYERLSSPVFGAFPPDVAGCERALAELELLLPQLQTRGRARFNVRAWQLDLKRHAILLGGAQGSLAAGGKISSESELGGVMEKLDRLAAECRFVEMANDLRSLSGDPAGAKRASLLALAEAAAIFLMDLEGDLAGGGATLNLALKSGETAQRIALKESGGQLVAEVAGQVREAKWADFTSDALIELHQSFVLQSVTGIERMRRHECAIAYSWLSGNRERARTAALALAEENASFKQRWESIAAGVPR
jgi:tRNA A-37 threonylcarbamoyl transferase component Bud32